MRPTMLRTALLAFLAATAISCSTDGPTAPARLEQFSAPATELLGTSIRVSEIHYDNTGADAGESIEISGPAGTDLSGWSVVLYNGSAPAAAVTYGTARALTVTIPATCNARGVVVLTYAVDGIQNGGSDGIALVNGTTVVELISYEGVLTAANGPAAGIVSDDIGVAEASTTPAGFSVQRNENGTWNAPAANTFGACNDGTTNPTPPAVVAAVTVTPATATVKVGATTQLTGSALDAANAPVAGSALTWASSANAIATVSASGLVSGVAVGEALVIATSANGKADTAAVTVEAATAVLPPVRFSEIHYDNFGTDANEAIEIEGPGGTDVSGWRIVLYNGNGGVTYEPTTTLTGSIPTQCDGRGTLAVTYAVNGLQNGAPDGFALVDASGALVEFLSYEGTFAATNGPAVGITSTQLTVSEEPAPAVGVSIQRNALGVWSLQPANPGYCFGVTPPPPPNTISFTGRDNSDPALPVGFEDQLFATLRSGSTSAVITTTFTWNSETPLIASIDANGVLRALGAGTAIVRATAQDGTSTTYSLATRVATASGTASYAGNTEFGDPTDGDASDEVIIRRDQYTSSFSPARGIPNWVSYDLEATHFGAEDRCDCFTYDSELPQGQRYTTADYTGAGTAAGYGIDRGHLARSFDRTSGSFDNATTFYFSNIIPQAADNNQGPWAQFENYLGDLARFSNKEVYIIAGASGSKGTVKNEGRITIPTATWKVAVVMPRDGGLSSVSGREDVEVVAVLMPNDAGIRNVPWQTYLTTVDAVESVSGFDLLSLLRNDIEIAIESNTVPPDAALDGPWAAYAGDPLAMSAAGSTDADGDALTYAWEFGDGSAATGSSLAHTFSAAGQYAVRLIVTDIRGLADTVTSAATITPLPPVVGISRARAAVAAFAESGALNNGQANSLRVKLDAAVRSIERGSVTAAAGQLEAFLNEVDALVRSGRLTRSQVDAVREVLGRVLKNL